jgi:hypothetical protein
MVRRVGEDGRAAVSAAIEAASGEVANLGSRAGAALGSRHLRTNPPIPGLEQIPLLRFLA